MSAILSADDLNDFISPGVACIKPIETIPKQDESSNPYEVTTEDKYAAANPAPAQISLTDCLACSGCVTSAEAVLVSLQSHAEVLNVLDNHPSLHPPWINATVKDNDATTGSDGLDISQCKIFVASVSPQARANLAAAYGITSDEAGNMIDHLLKGPYGLAAGGQNGSSFLWTLDTNVFRNIALVAAAEEVSELLNDPQRTPLGDGSAISDQPKKPILTSACPGWVCVVEKTHPHVLPHLSRLKSPQAIAGTFLKSSLYKTYNIHPTQIWHLAIMPCFDKKLEASRSELTSALWQGKPSEPIRDVDCVITPRELLTLASARGIDFGSLPRTPLSSSHRVPFPSPLIDPFLFPHPRRKDTVNISASAGTSGGYLWHILRRVQAANPGSEISMSPGRNADVSEYTLMQPHGGAPILRAARYYGSRNIQNLVRKLKPARTSRLLGARGASAPRQTPGKDGLDYAYVEVMACPGGCTNGGGQIRAGEAEDVRNGATLEGTIKRPVLAQQKEWLAQVNEAYYSAEDESDASNGSSEASDTEVDSTPGEEADIVDGISRAEILVIIDHWSKLTGIDKRDLLCTSFKKVESDVGKKKENHVERVVGLASSIGGGW